MNISSSNILQAKKLGKQITSSVGTLNIFYDINISVKQGESLAIIGVSGSGKSTLLGLLAGLDTPTSGSIYFNGEDFSKLEETKQAKIRNLWIGFIFQSFYLLPNLTALENTALPAELTGIENATEMAKQILDDVGLSNRMHHYPNQLSGGEQQRIAIARAFINSPKIIFADEPTGSLDQKTSQLVIELLFKINKEKNTTLIMVTHDQKIADNCQHKLLLENGQLTEIL